jgi:hypothetical protein
MWSSVENAVRNLVDTSADEPKNFPCNFRYEKKSAAPFGKRFSEFGTSSTLWSFGRINKKDLVDINRLVK